ncbi:feruloyl esterase B [Xylariaceae sp. FL0255]|nr:feruloyl esterase B [Xylariaceae sp. FL0255]
MDSYLITTSLLFGQLDVGLNQSQVACASLDVTPPPGSSVLNITGTERYGATAVGAPEGGVDICDVKIYLTHGNAGDEVLIEIWLPLNGWNGRFQATGGGGFIPGWFEGFAPVDGLSGFGLGVAEGYATACTDAGVSLEGDPSSWFDSAQLVDNFVYLAYHETAIVGKQVTAQFYGEQPQYSYFVGCSQGGRHGYSEAQRYPEGYDGIMAAAPAVSLDRAAVALGWPYVVTNQVPGSASACILRTITNASIAACDLLDGAADGLISDPRLCHFDALSQVGAKANCEDGPITITQEFAEMWNNIRKGITTPNGTKLWYDLQPGTDFSALPGFEPAKDWIRDFLQGDPSFDVGSMKPSDMARYIDESMAKRHVPWATDNPDLSAFKKSGGKLLTWHGWADEYIFPGGTLDYWQRVVEMSSEAETDEFYRIFIAPGAGHYLGGIGPQIMSPLAVLVDWVENGNAPETLPAAGNGQTRNVCKHPKRLHYKGDGDTSDASSWECV